ncbi:MAG: YfhO family protein [Anaerolineae bacterium]
MTSLKKRWAKNKDWLTDVGVVLLLACLCLFFFWRIITPNLANRGSFPEGDFADQFYAFGVYEVQRLFSGQLPLWNPYTFSGQPFLADVQSAIFYPPSLITLLLSLPQGFSLFALELEAIFHFFLAGLFTYLLAKRLLRDRQAALISSLVFTFGGYLTSYPSQQLAILETDVWLPLILLLLDIGLEQFAPAGFVVQSPDCRIANPARAEKFSLSVVLLPITSAGLAFGLALLAGHPQSAMYVFYVSAIYFAFRVYTNRVRWQPAVMAFGLFALLGFGLAAAQLLPSLEYMRLSSRAQANYSEMSGGFPRQDPIQLLLPGSVSIMSPLYVGILPLFLACLAPLLKRNRYESVRSGGFGREVIFWACLALGALLLSFGGNTFTYSLFYLFAPGFALFRSQERAAFVFSFSLALLAGYGVRLLIQAMPKPVKARFRGFYRFLMYLGWGALGLVLLTFYGFVDTGQVTGSAFSDALERSILLVILLTLSLGLLYLRLRRIVRERLLVGLFVVLIVFDLFTVNWDNNFQETRPEEQYGPTLLTQILQGDEEVFRVYNEWRLPGNYGCVYGLEDIWGASPLYVGRYEELVYKLPTERVWQLLNVKYVITWRKVLVPETEVLYEEPKGLDKTYLHRLDEYWPRAFVVHQVEVIEDGEQVLERLGEPEFDPRRVAILPHSPDLALPSQVEGESPVVILERQPERMVLEVDMAADGLLVLSEVYYPGWRAYADGEEVPIYRADHVLRAMPLRAGHHRVEMVFDPLWPKVGLAVSGVTLLLAAVLIAVAMARRKAKG